MKELIGTSLSKWRWMIACALIIGLAMLTQFCLSEGQQAPRLGLEARWQDQRLIVSKVELNSYSWDAAIRIGQEITAIDGQPVSPSDQAPLLDNAHSIQTMSSDGQSHYVSAKIGSSLYQQRASFVIVAAIWMIVSVVVFVLATDLLAASALLALALCGSTLLLTSIASSNGSTWSLIITGASFMCAGPVMLYFCLVFPVRRLGDTGLRRATVAILAFSAIPLLLQAWIVLEDNSFWYELIGTFLRYFSRFEFIICVIGAVVLLLTSLRSPSIPKQEVRGIISILALSFIAGFAPFCLVTIIPELLGHDNSIHAELSIIASLIIPITLGVAVLSKQFFGIRHVVQRGLITLIVWLLLLVAYTAIIGMLVSRGVDSPLLDAAIFVFTFPFVQHYSRHWLERKLLADVYDCAVTLREMAAKIVVLNDLDEIAQYVLDQIARTIDLQWAVIVLTEGDAQPLVYTWGNCAINIHEITAIDFGDSTIPTTIVEFKALDAHALPLIADGAKIGVFCLGPKRREPMLTTDDIGLVSTIAPVIAIALRNALLVHVQGQQLEMLGALSGKMMRMQEDIQHQLALELHDEPLQRALLLARELDEKSIYRQEIDEIIASLRAICVELHPPILDDFGLVPGLERLASNLCARSDLFIDLIMPDRKEFGRLDHDLETALYHVAQEALNNTIKHANATKATLSLSRNGDHATMNIIDDGCGLKDKQCSGDRLGLGILGMRERLKPWGGVLTIYSPPNGGTVVSVDVTCLHAVTAI